MKKHAALVFGLALMDVPALAENGVYKCTGADQVIVYQGEPCQARHQQITLVEPRKREPVPLRSEAAKSGTEGDAPRSALGADELVAGMSDTKVLNMRGWGRPQRIERSRGQDGFREEWTYVSRSDGATRLVSFVNGKVANIRSEDALQAARARQETQILADQTRRSIDSLKATQATTRDAQPIERAAVPENSPPSATVGRPTPAIEASGARTRRWQPEDPSIDHAARAAAALARIEESRREPVQDIRAEPTLRHPEPVTQPVAAIVQSSAESHLAPSQETTVAQ